MTMKCMHPAFLTLVLVVVMEECQAQMVQGILLRIVAPSQTFPIHDIVVDPARRAEIERIRQNQNNRRQTSWQDETGTLPSNNNVPVSNIPQMFGQQNPASDQKPPPPHSGFAQPNPTNQGGSSPILFDNAQQSNQQMRPVQQGVTNQQGGNIPQAGSVPQVPHSVPTIPSPVHQHNPIPPVPAHQHNPIPPVPVHPIPSVPAHQHNPIPVHPIPSVPAHPHNPIPPVPAHHGSFDQHTTTPATQHNNSNHQTQTPAGNVHSSPASSHKGNPSSVPGQREPLCGQKPYPGECRAAFPRYFYNTTTGQCDCFFYGGCGSEGLESSYRTMAECVQRCLPENTQEGPQCKEVFRKQQTFFAPPPGVKTQGTKNQQQEPHKTPGDPQSQKELLELFEREEEEYENKSDNDRLAKSFYVV